MKVSKLLVLFMVSSLIILEATYFYYLDVSKVAYSSGEVKVLRAESKIEDNLLDLKVKFRLDVSTSTKFKARALLIPSSIPANDISGKIYVYFDERYNSHGFGLREWIGLRDHIPIELNRFGFDCEVVNADQLNELIVKDPPGAIIFPSGTLPEEVFYEEGESFSKWLSRGGVLFWIGGEFARMIAFKNGTLEDIGRLGQHRLLGYSLEVGSLNYWEAVADEWTLFAEGLMLSYPHTWTGPPLSVVKEHGIAIGGIYHSDNGAKYSSISVLSAKGDGKVIIFGGGVGYAGAVLGEDFIARDIAKIIWSGLPFTSPIRNFLIVEGYPSLPVAYTSYLVDNHFQIEAILNVTGSVEEFPGSLRVVLLVYSMNPHMDLNLKTEAFT